MTGPCGRSILELVIWQMGVSIEGLTRVSVRSRDGDIFRVRMSSAVEGYRVSDAEGIKYGRLYRKRNHQIYKACVTLGDISLEVVMSHVLS